MDVDDGYGPPTQMDEDWYWQHVGLPYAVGVPMIRVARRVSPEPGDQPILCAWTDDESEHAHCG